MNPKTIKDRNSSRSFDVADLWNDAGFATIGSKVVENI